MSPEVIPHVFASLQTLERYLEQVRTLSTRAVEFSAELRTRIPEFERVVKQMRRTANKLQFQVAANNQAEIVRSLRIFYGLNHMLRPELLSTLIKLTKGSNPLQPKAVAASLQDVH